MGKEDDEQNTYKKVVRQTLSVIKRLHLTSNFSNQVGERLEARSSRLNTMFLRHAAGSLLTFETIGENCSPTKPHRNKRDL